MKKFFKGYFNDFLTKLIAGWLIIAIIMIVSWLAYLIITKLLASAMFIIVVLGLSSLIGHILSKTKLWR